MRVLDHLLKAVRDAAVFNPEVQVAPACILWPDRDRQWEAVIPVLQAELPELMILGDYAPDKRIGPAIWLRCVIAGVVEPRIHTNEHKLERQKNIRVDSCPLVVPVLYLPGVSRQDLRAVESCPDHLKALAELQYRGVIWSQINAKDWTILAWLKSDQGGLGLDVAQDNDAKNAMQLALHRLLEEDVSLLKAKRLDKDYFNTLLTGGDPIRDLLQWLDQGETFRASRGENEWKAFVEVCKSQIGFDPDKQGLLSGASLLANRAGAWCAVWERFREAPRRYPAIPSRIRQCQMPPVDLATDERTHGGWPQWNEAEEITLRQKLLALVNYPPHEARTIINTLDQHYGYLRGLVWAELGEAPLALALGHLVTVAEATSSTLAAGTLEDLAAAYSTSGWRADDGVLRALAEVGSSTNLEAVSTAIRAIYLPWIEESARFLQKIWPEERPDPLSCQYDTDCVLFVDGLRLDCARRLVEILRSAGCEVEETSVWAALPSVTATGKAAVAPIANASNYVKDDPAGTDFELMSWYQLHKAIEEGGYTVVAQSKVECTSERPVWCEFGDIDHEGHARGWKLAHGVDTLIHEIRERIVELLATGHQRIKVVTDHGWLLLPGGLPKSELPGALVESKWGRCAALKEGALTSHRLYPWYWNPDRHFALADGVSCFRSGQEYAHGGLSLQECLTIQLTITAGATEPPPSSVTFTDVVWKGLRCTVAVDGSFHGLSLDIRRAAGDAKSSVVLSVKPLKENGTASVVVENEDLEGQVATIVLLDADGSLVGQIDAVLGGEK